MAPVRDRDAPGETGRVALDVDGVLTRTRCPSSRPATCRQRNSSRHWSTRRTSASSRSTTARTRDVYPALARVPRELFGICVVGTGGDVYAVGDADYQFTIMSVSKPFVFALVCQALGAEEAREQARGEQHRAAVQLADGDRAERRTADQPDGQLGRDRDDQPRPGRHRRGEVAVHPRRAVALRRPRRCRSTTRSTPPRRPPTTATRASPACCRATTGSTSTRPRRPTSTPGSAR